jgi:hypothetical protein
MNKHERFLKVAEARTQKILDDLEQLSHCARSVSYEYTEEEVKKIFTALDDGLKKAEGAFHGLSRFSLTIEE